MSYGIGGLVVAWAIGGTLTVVFACQPIHKSWDTQIPGHCINEDKLYWGLQIPNIVTDFAILIMPFLPLSGMLATALPKCLIHTDRYLRSCYQLEHQNTNWSHMGLRSSVRRKHDTGSPVNG